MLVSQPVGYRFPSREKLALIKKKKRKKEKKKRKGKNPFTAIISKISGR